MLITASTEGHYGHKPSLETLRVVEARNIDSLQMVISFVKTKVNVEGKITDARTLDQVNALVKKFVATMNDEQANLQDRKQQKIKFNCIQKQTSSST